MNARAPGARQCDSSWRATSGEQKSVVLQCCAVIEPDSAGFAVDVFSTAREAGVDTVVRIELSGPDQKAISFERARQVFLGQRRALVRQVRLRSDQRYRALESFPSQRI